MFLERAAGEDPDSIAERTLDAGESAFLSTLAGIATLEAAATRAFAIDESFDLATTFAALLQNQILQLESSNE